MDTPTTVTERWARRRSRMPIYLNLAPISSGLQTVAGSMCGMPRLSVLIWCGAAPESGYEDIFRKRRFQTCFNGDSLVSS